MFSVPLKVILISLGIHSLWGGNPIAAKFGMLAFPPYWSAFIRFVFGIVVILVWAKLNNRRVWPARDEWWTLFVISIMFTIQIGAMNVGIDRTTGAMASVLIATNPIFAAIFAHFMIPGDRLSPHRTIGLIVALTGVGLCLMPEGIDSVETPWRQIGNWICLFSATLLGFRLVVSARALKRIDGVRVAVWQMMFSLPIFAAAGWAFETIRWAQFGWAPMLGLIYQGVVVAGLGFMVSFWLMSRYQPSIIMSFNFVSPVVGVLLAIILLGDSMSWTIAAGVALVALGLFLITRQSESQRPQR